VRAHTIPHGRIIQNPKKTGGGVMKIYLASFPTPDQLIKNAVENTPDGGEIVVSLSRVENGVCLEVMDYGIGIPAKDRDFIFKAFHLSEKVKSDL